MRVRIPLVPPMNFCDKCNKIVPDSEVKDLFHKGIMKHIYTKWENAYKHQRSDMIGCCLQEETVFCGNIREPDEYEYFIYVTLAEKKKK